MSRLTRRDEFGAYASLQPPRRGQSMVRELLEQRARLDAPPIEVEPRMPEFDKATAREGWLVLLLAVACLAGALLHWLFLH